MNWRGLVLMGLVALAAVETAHAKSSRNLRGFVMSSYQGSAPTTSQSDPWAGWPDNDEEDDCYKPKPCTPSPKPCIPSPKPCTPSPTCNPNPRPCDSPMPQPSPVQPMPSPVAAVSPPPSSPCKVDDWKCNNCYMYAKGNMGLFQKCYDCYTSPNQKDDSCAQCTWTYVSDPTTAYKCIADVKAGCPYWTWDSCKQKAKGDDKYMTACVNCILGTQQKRAVKDDYSGCTMCADACSDATKMGSCSACWLAGGNNYYCSKCQTSAMGADQCYSCLTSKGPFTWDCVK